MFALSLSLKILTACLIQGVDKKRMKSTESHLRSNVRWKRFLALRPVRSVVSHFIGFVPRRFVFHECFIIIVSFLRSFQSLVFTFTFSKIRPQCYIQGLCLNLQSTVSFQICFRLGLRRSADQFRSHSLKLKHIWEGKFLYRAKQQPI